MFSRTLSALRWCVTASPRRLVIALGGLVVAAAVAVASGANFNSTSANPGSLITAGSVVVTDSRPGNMILSASPMKPGSTTTGTVDISNGGNVASTFALTKVSLLDTPASPALSGKLTLTVEDLGSPTCTTGCPSPATIYAGALGSMGSIALGTFPASTGHRYKFSVTFPDGGSDGADNAYGGAGTVVDYRWTASQ
jgi:hypothetical protein